jgi:hypothetical protein
MHASRRGLGPRRELCDGLWPSTMMPCTSHGELSEQRQALDLGEAERAAHVDVFLAGTRLLDSTVSRRRG